MIQESKIRELVNQYLTDNKQDTDYELINLQVSSENEILVEIDSLHRMDLDFCSGLNQYLQSELDKTGENYSLEVGSVSLTEPFKTLMQYKKHLGDPVEVMTSEGKKLFGTMTDVRDEDFEVEAEELVSVEGKKRKQKQMVSHTLRYDEIRYAQYDLKV